MLNIDQIKKLDQCQVCKEYFEPGEMYEYRGFIFCGEHHGEGIGKVDNKRQEVMETVNASTKSQRTGEFVNNRKKYDSSNVASDGLPVIPINEPQILKDYEQVIL